MKHLDLFSGIGGFALAAQTVWDNEYENVGFCDNEPFSQAIIKKHWPHATIFQDIKNLLNPPAADLITGGFPCQPFSVAGKRRGTQDDRHLWPEMFRIIRISAPRWVIAENVGGLLTWGGGVVLDGVCADLESANYQVWPFVLPVAGVGAYHRRERVWIIAHRDNQGLERRRGASLSNTEGVGKEEQKRQKTRSTTARRNKNARDVAHAGSQRRPGTLIQSQTQRFGGYQAGTSDRWREGWPQAVARLCDVAYGLPGGLVRPRGWRGNAIKAAGNAIVPQVAAEIMFAIKAADKSI